MIPVNFNSKISGVGKVSPIRIHCIDLGNHTLILNTVPTLTMTLNINRYFTGGVLVTKFVNMNKKITWLYVAYKEK